MDENLEMLSFLVPFWFPFRELQKIFGCNLLVDDRTKGSAKRGFLFSELFQVFDRGTEVVLTKILQGYVEDTRDFFQHWVGGKSASEFNVGDKSGRLAPESFGEVPERKILLLP